MNAETLRRLTSIDMPAESLREVLIVLADVQAAEDARKAGRDIPTFYGGRANRPAMQVGRVG